MVLSQERILLSSLRGQLAKSGDDAQLENGGGCGAATVHCLETRDAVRHSTMLRTTQDKKESSPKCQWCRCLELGF